MIFQLLGRFLLLTTFCFTTARAELEIPQNLLSGQSDFLTRSLKESCFSMATADISMGRPCNPAFLGLQKEEKFLTHVFWGHNVRYLSDAIEVLNYKASTDTVRSLFNQSHDAEFEADIEMYYRKDDWTLSFSPSRVSYYSLIHNHVLPRVRVYLSQEQVLRAQKSWSFSSDWHLGIQAKGIVRKFLLSEFFLTDAVVEDSKALLKVRHQNLFFVEPGVLWAPHDRPLEPQISATITQLGVISRRISSLDSDPEAEIGATISPEIGIGTLRLGPHISLNSRSENWEDHIRFSTIFEILPWQTTLSFQTHQANIGAYYQLQKFTGGLLYDFQFIENLQGRDEFLNTWFFQLGYEI